MVMHGRLYRLYPVLALRQAATVERERHLRGRAPARAQGWDCPPLSARWRGRRECAILFLSQHDRAWPTTLLLSRLRAAGGSTATCHTSSSTASSMPWPEALRNMPHSQRESSRNWRRSTIAARNSTTTGG